MTGPKHLWSGDWERESTRPPSAAPAPTAAPSSEPPAAAEPGPARWWRRRVTYVALSAAVATAAVAVVLVTALGTGGSAGSRTHAAGGSTLAQGAPPHAPSAGVPGATRPQPTATAVVTGPTANWLGMQIVTSPLGVVISTVALGSPADRAGFEPGDEIEEINGHQITSIRQIASLTRGIALGRPVTIQVLRDSVLVQAGSMPMTERPTIHP